MTRMRTSTTDSFRGYIVRDLVWYTPVSYQPRATLLIAEPTGMDSPDDAQVIFRLDANQTVCAHSHNIIITQPMMDFAKKVLPTLARKAEREYEKRSKENAKRFPGRKAAKRKAA